MSEYLPASQKTLLSNIIDYAGLFPPASLSLEQAIDNFIHYQSDRDHWMLSKFIIPSSRLSELSSILMEDHPSATDLSFSVLGSGGKNWADYSNSLISDLKIIDQFREAHLLQATVDYFETRLPKGELGYQLRADNLVQEAADLLIEADLMPFFETSFDDEWQKNAETLIRALQKHNRENPPAKAGFKLRTGGVKRHMFPTTAQVAWAITVTRDAGVPMKATAGLHHPVRHFNTELGAKMHGFLNLFGASVLARAHNLSEIETKRILEDEDPKSFKFEGQIFSWKNRSVSEIQIQDIRRSTIVSFGSCSFDEPRDDLFALGLF